MPAPRSPDRIIRLRGSSIDRGITSSAGNAAIRAYRISQVMIGDPEAYEKLLRPVVDNGDQNVVINKVRYDRVFVMTIRVTGFLAEQSGKQSVSHTYTIVYDFPPET